MSIPQQGGPTMYLPDQLYSGDILESKTGLTVRVIRTTRRDHNGERLYRLAYPRGTTSDPRWTRDALQAAGVKYVGNLKGAEA